MNDFKAGDAIYHVHAFPLTGKTYTEKCIVHSVGTKMSTGSPSMYVKPIHSMVAREISLLDANIIPNKYNSHRIFKTELEAEDYVAHPSQWRPLGYSQEDWDDHGKAAYLDDKALVDIGWEFYDDADFDDRP
jgi:hypothetical protein